LRHRLTNCSGVTVNVVVLTSSSNGWMSTGEIMDVEVVIISPNVYGSWFMPLSFYHD
jgi:hypothetical protein